MEQDKPVKATRKDVRNLLCSPAYARLWSEEAAVRIYQRLIDTAHRLKYLEEGSARLAHQRDTDPVEIERARERLAAQMKGFAGPRA